MVQTREDGIGCLQWTRWAVAIWLMASEPWRQRELSEIFGKPFGSRFVDCCSCQAYRDLLNIPVSGPEIRRHAFPFLWRFCCVWMRSTQTFFLKWRLEHVAYPVGFFSWQSERACFFLCWCLASNRPLSLAEVSPPEANRGPRREGPAASGAWNLDSQVGELSKFYLIMSYVSIIIRDLLMFAHN